MPEQVPRPLTTREGSVLDALLSLAFPGVELLRKQAASALARRTCPCGCASIEIIVRKGTAPAAQWSGILPCEATVDFEGPVGPTSIILFASEGRLSYLEHVTYLDVIPTEFPDPTHLSVTLVER